MVLFPAARVRAPTPFKKEKMAILEDVIRRGSTEDPKGKTILSSENDTSAEAEEFANVKESDEAASPIARSPVIQPAKIEGAELQLEHATRGFHGFGGLRHTSLLICSTTPAGQLFLFAATAMANGGTAFILIYLILLSCFGIPFALLEISVGQYTSLPVISVFERIAPAASGVGLLMLIVRLINSLFLSIQPKFLVYFYNFLLSSLTGDTSWLSCDSYPQWPCSEMVCDTGELHYNHTCVKEDLIDQLPRNSIVDILRSSEPVVSFTPAHIFEFFKRRLIFCLELTAHRETSLLLSSYAMLVISGIIAYRGNKFFGSIAPILCFFPLIGFFVLICYCLFSVCFDGNFMHILQGLEPRWAELATIQAWLHAALAVLNTVGLGDGTLLTLGSQADFNNNLINDVTYMTIGGATLRILATITVIFLMAASRLPVSVPVEDIMNLDIDESLGYWRSLPFSALPSLSLNNGVHQFVATVFYFCMILSLIGFQVVTIEMTLSAIYRTFSPLIHLPDRLTRYCLVCLVISLMSLTVGVVYQFEFSTHNVYHKLYVEIFAVLIIYIIITILCTYGASRLIVNLETMSGKYFSAKRIAWGSRVTWVVWVFILPCFAFAVLVTSGIHHKYTLLSFSALGVSFMSVIPLITMTHKVVYALANNSRVYPLFQPHPKWGPMNIQNRRRAARDEMANRIFLY